MIPLKNLSQTSLGLFSRRSLVIAGMAGLMVLSTPALLKAQEDTAARQAILSHPNVDRLRAEVCQYYAQADIARAGQYPQVNLRVNGGASLKSNFETREVRARRFDDREIDAVVGVRQNVYDWGIVKNSVRIAETNRVISRIDLTLEKDRQATDLLSLLVRYRELSEQDKLYQTLRAELDKIAIQIEEGVNAGALTLTDLRDIKISNLDIEVAHLQVMRELSILEEDLQERFQLSITQAMPFLVRYTNTRPNTIPVVPSTNTNEVRKLDLQEQVSGYELNRLKAQRKPALSAIVDTTFFDVDGYSQEYEVAGRLEISMPLYDGGSNKANRREVEWQSRSIVNERSGLIRSFDAQMAQIRQSLIQLDENIDHSTVKIIATESQLEAHLAREGQTVSQPLVKASLLTQLNQLQRDHISLNSEREVQLMRGLFFTDAIGGILKLSDEVTPC